ncbi:MAG: protein kinase [Planctomycetaceae bacterium]|nr:protein kinase [Planctomycetales bacterium]MCB9923564.1 protein kinase [Planctomycetaceae bacterium]
MTVQSCPNWETMQHLLAGTLHGSEAEQLETHLLECEQCLSVARTVPANDDLVAAIRARREFSEDTGVLDQAIQQAKQLHAEVETVESVDTVVTRDRMEPNLQQPTLNEDIDFLAPPERPDEVGRLGGYRVLELLGIGGMGVVFRAEDMHLQRQIALKAMKPAVAASRSAKERFVREAQATAAIDHDNIVHIYQVGEDRNVPFIAMQFLRGESLQQRLQRESRLDQREVVRIGREVAAGLAAAHQRGLIHRDIKPDNIWLDAAAAHRAKILDFGLVRSATDDAGLTQSGMVLGTPKYMAPEQAKGETVDYRCDLFSLGGVLYHLASGKAPFEGGSVTATLLAVSRADCRPIVDVYPDLHPELARLITRLLSKNREARLQSAAEVADSLAHIARKLDDERPEQSDKTIERQLTVTTECSPVSAPAPASATSTTAVQPPDGTDSRKVWLSIGGAAVATALAVFAWLYFAGIAFQVENKDGTLTVKVSGDNITASVEGRKITIKRGETGEVFTVELDSAENSTSLKPGSYFILEFDSGWRTLSDHFTIRSGETQVVEVAWVQKTKTGPADVVSNGPDRRAAEWVLSIGGRVRIHGIDGEIRSKTALPERPFILDMVWLRDNQLATDAGLAVFADCEHLSELTHLDLRNVPVTDAGLAHFKNCRNLLVLDIPYTQLSDRGLASFKQCKNLTSLWLNGTLVTDAGLANFQGCKNLAQLGLWETNVTNDGLAHFTDSRSLIQLYLGGTRIDDTGLAHFKGCTSFREVNLSRTQVSDAGIAMFHDCKNLGTLRVNQTNVTATGVNKLRSVLPNCKVDWQSSANADALVAGLTPIQLNEFDKVDINLFNEGSGILREIRDGRHFLRCPAEHSQRGRWGWPVSSSVHDGIIDVTARVEPGGEPAWLVVLHSNDNGHGVTFNVNETRVSIHAPIFDPRKGPEQRDIAIAEPILRGNFHRLQVVLEGDRQQVTAYLDGKLLCPPIALDKDISPCTLSFGIAHSQRDQTGQVSFERYAIYPLRSTDADRAVPSAPP